MHDYSSPFLYTSSLLKFTTLGEIGTIHTGRTTTGAFVRVIILLAIVCMRTRRITYALILLVLNNVIFFFLLHLYFSATLTDLYIRVHTCEPYSHIHVHIYIYIYVYAHDTIGNPIELEDRDGRQ